MFIDCVKDIYLFQVNVEKAYRLDDPANYLTLTFSIHENNRLYEKRDDLNLHIVNFPLLSSNASSGPSYGVSILQLIRYARYSTYCDDFRKFHKLLVDRLLSQDYKVQQM